MVNARPFMAASVTYGEIEYPPESTFGPFLQPCIELSFIHSGGLSLWVDDKRYEVGSGSVCLVLPGHTYNYIYSQTASTQHSWLHFWSKSGYDDTLIERFGRLSCIIRLSNVLAREQRYLLGLSSSRLTTRAELETLIAHRILYQFVGEAEAADIPQDAATMRLDAVVQHIDHHLNAQHDLGSLADVAAVSPAHLIRLFRAQLGTTPGHYLWARRVDRAVYLLEETGLSLREIARRCGFKTSYHFSRKIHEATGLTPSQLRAAAKSRTM